MENTFRFTVDEWNGILHSATIAIAISLLSNILVMLLHLVMMRYKPNSVNRVSLRMIVLACLCNSIFCIFQSIIDDLPAKNLACGRIIHLVVAFDVMSCMSLAMIGLNLDLIFIAKVSQKHRWELMYYAIVILSGVIACVVPISLKKNRENPDLMGTCWYRFFFFSRMNNIFNWLWYYSLLLATVAFAVICSTLSIIFIMKEKYTVGMDNRLTYQRVRKYSSLSTSVFQKIARRCSFYPLIPLFSKSWGVGIEIASAFYKDIPYPVYILDRIFSCLLGFMASIIYFTDPAIIHAMEEWWESLKKKYVYNYYTVLYKPGRNEAGIQNLRSANIKPSNHLRYGNEDGSIELRRIVVGNDTLSTFNLMRNRLERYSSHPTIRTDTTSGDNVLPSIKLIEVKGLSINQDYPEYKIISVTSTTGDICKPKALEYNKNSTFLKRLRDKNSPKIIPMKRINNNVEKNQYHRRNSELLYQRHTNHIDTLVPIRFPLLTRLTHWIMVNIFKVNPPLERLDQELPSTEETSVPPSLKQLFTEQEEDYTQESQSSQLNPRPGTTEKEDTMMKASESNSVRSNASAENVKPRKEITIKPKIKKRISRVIRKDHEIGSSALNRLSPRPKAPPDHTIEVVNATLHPLDDISLNGIGSEPFPNDRNYLSYVSVDDGLSEGETKLFYIKNWEEDGRLIEFRESWDLEEQIEEELS